MKKRLFFFIMIMLMASGCYGPKDGEGMLEVASNNPLSPAIVFNGEISPAQDPNTFPVPDGVTSVVVEDKKSGSIVNHIEEGEKVRDLLDGLREAAETSVSLESDFTGSKYIIHLTGRMAASKGFSYEVDDMRATDSIDASVKVYAEDASGHYRAWSMPSRWIERLLSGPSVADEDDSSKPYLYVSSFDNSGSVLVMSNKDIQRSSVSAAIDSTLFSSGYPVGISPAYHIYWSDPRRFVVRITDWKSGMNVRFRLDDVMTETGEKFSDEEVPNRNTAVVFGPFSAHRLRWIGAEGNVGSELSLDRPALLLQPIRVDAAETYAIMAYHADGSTTLIRLDTMERRTIRITEWPDHEEPFGNNYGTNVLFGDVLMGKSTYAVYGNRTVYRIDLEEGTATKLYVSARPIYGVAISPEGKRVAILSSSDKYLGSFADLTLLKTDGSVASRWEKAAYAGHSDGFLFVYPMAWTDDHTVALPWIGNGNESFVRGRVLLDIRDGSSIKVADAELPADAAALLRQAAGKAIEVTRILPQPEGRGKLIAVETTDTGAWLIDRMKKKVTFLGQSHLLKWIDHDVIAVFEEGRERIYDIGMDTGQNEIN
ncbi:hypothetical protein [Paenibacillus xanthanilyticus]|uniref:Lipoprotein LpqB beta-propeller domain-containing protein n=1 Tax=Paenibacillus xanthanilyticus TaxID=1783531 RepID=A0ABV8K6K0_9BACL